MPTINWNESNPQDTDSAGLGDDEFRSLKTSIRVGLDGEHVWPSAGGNAGVHRLGSARPYYGAQSLVSSTGTDARLMQTSDTSRLFHVGSAGTSLIGGATVISAGSYPGGAPPQRYYWAQEFGVGLTASGATNISYPSSYSGSPYVVVTPTDNAAILWTSSVGAGSFTVNSRATNGATLSSASFTWFSIGTRVL